MQKVIYIVLALFLCASMIPAFAAGQKATGSEKSLFQKISDTVEPYGQGNPSKTGKKSKAGFFQEASDHIKAPRKSGEKPESLTRTFQKSHDYIVESSPKAKQLSLRNQEKELKRRRKGKRRQ